MKKFVTIVTFLVLFLAAPSLGVARGEYPKQKMDEIKAVLKDLWGSEFESNWAKYILGESPVINFVPRSDMILAAQNSTDGKKREGKTLQGFTVGYEKSNIKIVVVYDDIPALFVARSINHELGHYHLRSHRLPDDVEEAYIRKNVDPYFFQVMFGKEWLDETVADLKTLVTPAKDAQGRVYQGYTNQARDKFYEKLEEKKVKIKKTDLNNQIVDTLVFSLVNSEEDLSAALLAGKSSN